MSFLASLLGGIGTAASSVGSTLGSIGSAVGQGLGSAASTVGNAIGSGVSSIGNALGIGGGSGGAGAAASSAPSWGSMASTPSTVGSIASNPSGWGQIASEGVTPVSYGTPSMYGEPPGMGQIGQYQEFGDMGAQNYSQAAPRTDASLMKEGWIQSDGEMVSPGAQKSGTGLWSTLTGENPKESEFQRYQRKQDLIRMANIKAGGVPIRETKIKKRGNLPGVKGKFQTEAVGGLNDTPSVQLSLSDLGKAKELRDSYLNAQKVRDKVKEGEAEAARAKWSGEAQGMPYEPPPVEPPPEPPSGLAQPPNWEEEEKLHKRIYG